MSHQDQFEYLLRLYWANQWLIDRNPIDFDTMAENEHLYFAMSRLIPQSHYDQINEVVYGIKRKL